jgi:hypothetical protein
MWYLSGVEFDVDVVVPVVHDAAGVQQVMARLSSGWTR